MEKFTQRKRSGNLLILIALVVSIVQGCKEPKPIGFIQVSSPSEGRYEIYRIDSEFPYQFVSEQIGYFNKKIPLTAGSYLILSDCSSEKIIVHPESTKHLIANQVNFKPPINPSNHDIFSTQCDRFEKTGFRQHFTNKYSFHILQGNRDLLVGMVPFHIESKNQEDTPLTYNYNLSAIQVSSFEGMKPKTSFFVSPAKDLISITNSQEFGRWLFLIPGEYILEVNGTKMPIHLNKNEKRTINPAFLKIETPKNVNLELSSQIRGNPLFIELNENHWLNLNETYPVLPGTVSMRLNGSLKELKLDLEEGQSMVQKTHQVFISYDCSPWEWSCLGNKGVYLYEKDSPYPFSEGITDVPLLYFPSKVQVSVQGSRDVRYDLRNRINSKLKTGKVRFIPQHIHRPGQVTDLARIEAIPPFFSGHTLDLQLDREVELTLITGRYNFTQYISPTISDGERRKISKILRIQPNKNISIKYPVFLSETKLKSVKKAQLAKKRRLAKKRVSKYLSRFHPALSIKYQ